MGTTASASLDAIRSALASGQSALLWRKLIADTETPISAALKLMQPERGDFLLESVEGGAVRGRYSLLGLDPDLVFRAEGDSAEINRAWQTDRAAFAPLDGGALAGLRALVRECRAEMDPALPPALACLVGHFGYETIGLVEKLPRPAPNPLGLPDMLFVRPSVILVFDRLEDALFLVAPIWAGSVTQAERAIDAAQERLDATAARLGQPVPPAPQIATPDEVTFTPVLPDGKYRDMVLAAQDYIVAGDIFQVVLAQRFTAPFPLPPLSLYRALQADQPLALPLLPRHAGLRAHWLQPGDPRARTRWRGDDTADRRHPPTRQERERGCRQQGKPARRPEGARRTSDVARSGAQRCGRRVAAAGTVQVTDSYAVEFYSHVMHIVSNVVGRLGDGKDALDALFAGFPAGTVSGAPKVRACEIIAELEPETRGAYAGGVGYFAPDGNMDSCIVLRTAVLKDGVMHAQAGAGIVADSTPEYEQRECEAKAGALMAAAREAVRLAQDAGYGQ
jgi:anthranilate synthase component 1